MIRGDIIARRICWPSPDTICLQGGCDYCNGQAMINISQIERYAYRNDSLRAAYIQGLTNEFCNRVQVRRSKS